MHLVASSVPELAPSAVSVLDDTGKLLSQSPDGGAGNGVDAQQLQYVQQIEQQYTRRIMDILEPVVGRDNVKAQVTAELDFSQTESTSEQYRPNQTPEAAAIRSQQVLENNETASSQTAGVAGAVANQPPGAIGRPHQRCQSGAHGSRPAGQREGHHQTRIHHQPRGGQDRARGAGQQLGRQAPERSRGGQLPVVRGEGKTVTKALTPEQVEQMTALVRETIGFNKDRGDSVNLMNAQFRMDTPPVDNTPLWKQPETIELARSFAWPVGMSLFAALVLLGLVRLYLKTLGKPRAIPMAGAQLDALEAETAAPGAAGTFQGWRA